MTSIGRTHLGNQKKMKNSSPYGHTPRGLSDFSADLAQKPLISKDSVNVKNQSLTNAKNNVIEFRVRQQKEKVAFF